MYNVLILEDDNDLSEILSIYLRKHNYSCSIAGTCHDARRLFAETEFDIVVTDMLLPDGTGESFCQFIRERKITPIIVISCLGDDDTIISAFKSGADDYITKPVNQPQLIARIEANIRRTKVYSNATPEISSFCVPTESDSETFEFCGMALNKRYRTVKNAEGEIELSPIEFSILSLFLSKHETLITYNDLYEFVWGKDSLGDYRAVMVHVSNLKRKIDPNNVGIITNVRGSGYLFSHKQYNALF